MFWFNWWTHRYSAGLGMVTALGVEFLRAHGLLQDADRANLFSRRLTALLAALGCFPILLLLNQK